LFAKLQKNVGNHRVQIKKNIIYFILTHKLGAYIR